MYIFVVLIGVDRKKVENNYKIHQLSSMAVDKILTHFFFAF